LSASAVGSALPAGWLPSTCAGCHWLLVSQCRRIGFAGGLAAEYVRNTVANWQIN
jgi:hypothetical protein